METFQARIAKIASEAIDVVSLKLVPKEGGNLPPVSAGSHIDVYVTETIVRQYSLCNGPDDRDHYLIAVKKEPNSRGGSLAVHERLKEGDEIRIGAPRNNFSLHQEASHHTLIAGGIGITPIFSMARHLVAGKKSFSLHYFTRSPDHTAFRAVLGSSPLTEHLHLFYALDPEAVKKYLRTTLWHRPPGGHLYICGPSAFMDVVEEIASHTWPPEAVHTEYFSADPRSLAGPKQAFEVVLSRSGVTVEVKEGQTIVDALAAKGIVVDVSCQQGICGTCLTGVLEGEPDHRDIFLTESEKRMGQKIMVCVSRALSPRLVLDL